MSKSRAVLGSIAFFLLAPGVVAFVIPALIHRWRPGPATDAHPVMAPVGLTLATLGLLALAGCFGRFALQGEGTPAPFAPPRRLVVEGLYRHVRNPMYLAVAAIVMGQAVAMASLWTAAYGLVLLIATVLFVRLYEEPNLAAAFPQDWPAYAAAVPAWLPRRRGWAAEDKS